MKAYAAWPADVQDEVDAQVAADAAVAGAQYGCSHLSTSDTSGIQSAAAEVAALTATSGAAASATRLALGLPIDRQ